MFEFLTGQNTKSINSVESAELIINDDLPGNEMIRTVESFVKLGDYSATSLINFTQELFSLIARQKEISQGVFFLCDTNDGIPVLKFLSGYAYNRSTESEEMLLFGEGLPGQVAKDGKLINITDIPDGYMSIQSGLGKASPASLIIFPIIHEGNTLAVIELASFHKFTREDEQFFEDISPAIAEQMLKCIANS
jgi:GAF domain-containing protein